MMAKSPLEPRYHVLDPAAFKRGDRPTGAQVHDDRIVAMSLAPGVFINPYGVT